MIRLSQQAKIKSERVHTMKTIANKEILMAADFAGCPLKNEVKEYLISKGWKVTDIGVQNPDDPEDPKLVKAAENFAGLLQQGAIKENVDTLFMGFTDEDFKRLKKEILK